MAFTVGELAKLTGVTVRTLHHYDEIGLVRPSKRSAAGYRLYAERDVLRLHQVLLFRELGLALTDIPALLERADSAADLLRQHREVLVTKRARLDAMLAAVDARLSQLDVAPQPSEGTIMTNEQVQSLFNGFDPEQYEQEAQARWGDTDAYRESARRTKGYTQADWERYKQEAKANGDALIALMRAGAPVGDARVQAAVEAHRMLIDRWFYPCSVAMHKKLGEMYVADARFRENLDRSAPGYALYLSEAIAASQP